MKFLKQSLVAASIITIGANIFSRFLGFFREAAIANFFGTSEILDTFILSFTIPELVSGILFMALPPAIIPLIKRDERNNNKSELTHFWSGLGLSLFIFLILSGITYFAKNQILHFLDPTLEGSNLELAKKILSISSWFILFRGLEAYFRSWLFAKKHFVIPGLSAASAGSPPNTKAVSNPPAAPATAPRVAPDRAP